MLTDNNWLLSVITFVPLVGAAIVMLIPKAEEQAIKMAALLTSLAALGLGIYMLFVFDYDAGGTLQFGVDQRQVDPFDLRQRRGVDRAAADNKQRPAVRAEHRFQILAYFGTINVVVRISADDDGSSSR